MINRIQRVLRDCGISLWRICETREETAEWFLVRHQLDTRRIKDVRKFVVTVFRDGTEQETGKATRGFTSVQLAPAISDEQLAEKLRDAYYAAQFAANPIYELPDPVQAPTVRKTGALAEAPLAESAGKMAEALLAPDHRGDAFLNSAELFVSRVYRRILSSNGTDVSYTDASVEGEFVVQCREPEDVELHETFSYAQLDPLALRKKVEEALIFVRDRAAAQRVLKSGKYDLILSGGAVASLLSYYTERSSASMLYARYSGWKQGENVQGTEIAGERLQLTLCTTVPYSEEGIEMKELPLLEEGILCAVHGSNRFCRYLGVEPTGTYTKVRCGNGTVPFEDLKRKPCLWTVTFSDFQMDSYSGHFGGEIRLAYLLDGEHIIPVTGGSVNGNLLEAQKQMVFSSERYETAAYEGPYAVRLSNVSVAGEGE